MNARAMVNFGLQFGVEISLNPDLLVQKNGRFFLVNSALKPFTRRDFYYAGTFLGKAKGGKFFPSFNLLGMLAKTEANKIVVDKRTAWLFICGRDVFSKGILHMYGAAKKGGNVLVLNEFGECLGFGKIVGNLGRKTGDSEIMVKNVLDIGDFLRRER